MNEEEKQIVKQEEWITRSLIPAMEKKGVMYYLIYSDELKKIQKVVSEIKQRREKFEALKKIDARNFSKKQKVKA